MPKVSRESAANVADMGLAEDRGDELDGYAVTFVTIRQDADLAPTPKGLLRSAPATAVRPQAGRLNGTVTVTVSGNQWAPPAC
jgi:hypothetical protein